MYLVMRQSLMKRFFGLVLLTLLFSLSGCDNGDEPATPALTTPPPSQATHQPTITPFLPEAPTATPSATRVWISPLLPDQILMEIDKISTLPGLSLEVVTEREGAQVIFGENPEVTKSNWIFALVAPFPRTMDSISYEELAAIWSGSTASEFHLLASAKNLSLLEVILGEVSDTNTTILEDNNLLETAWEMENGLAILPFEDLEPKWKVIAIDGVNPVHKNLIADVYPLSAAFGISGDDTLVQTLTNLISWPVSNRDPDKLTTVIMTGVTALTRATAWTMVTKGIEYPAEKIGSWLAEADITHISNEVSFLETCPPPKPDREGLIFCSDPDYVALLEVIGTDVIELTGNHIKDFGEESLLYSLELYRQLGWQYFGGGADLADSRQPAIFEHNGNRIAFVGCNSAGPPSVWAKEDVPGANPCEDEDLLELVRGLREAGVLPIFTYQWNEYYQPKPSTKQRQDFRAAVDAGAVIVSGSQAHQPQIYEFYNDGLIHYGLGNLFFDQMWSIATRQEFIDRHVIYDGRHISTEVLTAFLEDFAQPRPMTDEERAFFLSEIFGAGEW
jgi:poly-gamma-glutamate synthesis protein (capsule biosynthesis protein)